MIDAKDQPPASDPAGHASDSARARSRLAELRGAERWVAAQQASGEAQFQETAPRKPVPFRTRPSLDFSLIGLVYISMMIFMGLAAMNSQANLLFGVFGLMIGVLLISGVISRWVLRHVDVRRVLPEQAAVGEPVRIRYEIDNRKRWWPTLSLTIAELDAPAAFDRQPHTYVMHTAAGYSASVAAEVVPLRRGLHRLERYQLSTSFPFGFIKRAIIRRQLDHILIHPVQGAVEPRAMLRFLSAESTGTNQRPREGGNDEFFGVREYRAGDAQRMIHWRRSARTSATATPANPHGMLVVKQMTRVSPPRVMLLIDTYVPPAPDGAPVDPQQLAAVERNLAVAASLLTAATRNGLQVGLLAWNGKPPQANAGSNAGSNAGAKPGVTPSGVGEWLEMRPERGKRHRLDLLAALATLPRNTSVDAQALAGRGRSLLAGDTTGALITTRAGAAGDGGRSAGRGNLVSIETGSDQLDHWVLFPRGTSFVEMVQPPEAPRRRGRLRRR